MRSTFALLFYINRSKVKADGTTHRRQKHRSNHRHLLQARGLEPEETGDCPDKGQ